MPRKQPSSVGDLIAALASTDAKRRKKAAEELAELRDPLSVDALVAALQDRDEWVRYRAAEALAVIPDPAARSFFPLLARLQIETNQRVIGALAYGLGNMYVDERTVVPLCNALRRVNIEIGQRVCAALLRQGAAAIPEVSKLLGCPPHGFSVQQLLGALASKQASGEPAAGDKQDGGQATGQPATGREQAFLALLDSFRKASGFSRATACGPLAQAGGERAVPILIEALGDQDSQVRRDAGLALASLGAVAFGGLLEALRSDHPQIKDGAAYALAMTPEPLTVDLLAEVAPLLGGKSSVWARDALKKADLTPVRPALVARLDPLLDQLTSGQGFGPLRSAGVALEWIVPRIKGDPALGAFAERLRSLRGSPDQNVRYSVEDLLKLLEAP